MYKRLKIGLVSPFPPKRDGIAIYSNNLFQNFKRRIEVVRIGDSGSNAEYKVDFTSFLLRKQLKSIIEAERLELVHIQYVPSLFSKYKFNLNLIYALNQKKPVVVTLHEVHYAQKNLRDFILCCIDNSIIRNATRIIVHSPQQKRFLELTNNSANISCIYHGINLHTTQIHRGRNILFFGYITPLKGVDYLIRAMSYLPDFQLKIIGHIPKGVNPSYKDFLFREIKKNKLEDRICLEIRWIPEKQKDEYFRWSNMVILPYLWGPYQSGVLHNAIGYGVPVVVTKIGSLYEIVQQFKLGEICPPKNPKLLAKKIREIFTRYSFYNKGIISYRKLANWNNVAMEHISLYKSLCI